MSDPRAGFRLRNGSKGGGSSYDPEVGTAAAQEAATAQQAQDWTENYYNTTLTPLINAEATNASTTTQEEQQLFNVNLSDAQQQQQQYDQYGIPATANYYNMVNSYSAPAMEQQQAEGALGDNLTAQGAAAQTFNQQLAASGISATSPGAIDAMGQMDTQNAANNAAAETRARNAAQQLGIQLTSDAVNVANGGASQIVNSTGAASSNTVAGSNASATAVNAATSAASPEDSAATIASNAYGNNLSAYSKLGAADISASATEGLGIGSLLTAGIGGLNTAVNPGSILSGLGFPSDRRLKHNIVYLGRRLASGLKVYEYSYLWSPIRHVGVMAQEALRVIPDAVVIMPDGFFGVDYARVW